MRKSPLSTPRDEQRNHGNRGVGGRRGYGYNNRPNNNPDFQWVREFNSPHMNNQGEEDMIPLETSSPIHQNNRRGYNNWQQNDRGDQSHRYSNTGITGSHQRQRSRRGAFKQKLYPPSKLEPHWYRQLPISEIVDVRSLFDNPWAELEREMAVDRNAMRIKSNDSSVEIILEKNGDRDTSGSFSDTINISSSCDEGKEGSSIDLPLDNMSFNSDSKQTTNNTESQGEQSINESVNQSNSDSVIEIVY